VVTGDDGRIGYISHTRARTVDNLLASPRVNDDSVTDCLHFSTRTEKLSAASFAEVVRDRK
jgi:hypothetical protein